jgi:hypothetical protein
LKKLTKNLSTHLLFFGIPRLYLPAVLLFGRGVRGEARRSIALLGRDGAVAEHFSIPRHLARRCLVANDILTVSLKCVIAVFFGVLYFF